MKGNLLYSKFTDLNANPIQKKKKKKNTHIHRNSHNNI